MSGIDITTRGGLLQGKGKMVVTNAIGEINVDVSQDAYNRVQNRLASVLQHPTGMYQSRIVTDLGRDSVIISDGGTVYGPWLEGVSSRNNTTKFKGYNTFRLVLQEMQNDAPKKAERTIGREVGKLK